MHNNKDLLAATQANLQASSTDTQTEAGQRDSSPPLSDEQKEATFQAITQIFAEFELIYHNQYTKAFPTFEKLNYAKKLWYTHLCLYPGDQIVRAAKEAIRQSEYLPTIRGITKYLENDTDSFGLPEVHSAYLEACNAPSPKAEYPWRHLAVYHAGKNTGWFSLASQPESKTFPVFQQQYQKLCTRVRQGFELEAPAIEKLPDSIGTSLTKEEKIKEIKKIKKNLKNI